MNQKARPLRTCFAFFISVIFAVSMLPLYGAGTPAGATGARVAYAEGGASAQSSYLAWRDAGVFPTVSGEGGAVDQTDTALTRGEFARALDELVDLPWSDMAQNVYTDLIYQQDGSTYLRDLDLLTDMLKAVGAGYFHADESYAVHPYDNVTREDAVSILARALGIAGAEGATGFTDDASISDAARPYIKAMQDVGYLTGSAFDPAGSITYGEMAQLLDAMKAHVPAVASRATGHKTDWLNENCQEITVATVNTYGPTSTSMIPDSYTYEGGWIETDESGNITSLPVGTKDLNIRLWLPAGTQAGDKVPVLLYTFGGSWIRGNNQSLEPMMVEYLVEHGVAVASMTYRYEQEACFPYSLYDLQAQIRYLKIHADELGIDADNMGISGNSAGGYWCAELATTGNDPSLQDPGYVTFEGDQLGMLTTIKYAACQYGCFNMFNCADYVDFRIQDRQAALKQHDRAVSNDPNVMGTAHLGVKPSEVYQAYVHGTDDPTMQMMVKRFVNGSPVYNADSEDGPFFFYHGTADALCPINQAVEMYGKLCSLGIEGNEFRVCEGMGHGSRNLHSQYYLEMLDWIVERSGANEGTNLENAQVTGINASYPGTGSALELHPVVTLGGTQLVEGRDYTVSYRDATGAACEQIVDPGVYTVEAEGIGEYHGVASKALIVTGASVSRVNRIAGTLSSDTAAAIADAAYEGAAADTVLIARDDEYYDALSAAGLAGAYGAPILLTSSGELSHACEAEIDRLGAKTAIIIGGEGAVSSQVAEALMDKGLSVNRIAGDDVYQTSLACTRALLAQGGSDEYAIACNPTSFADAVSISGWAYAKRVPIMLQTWGDSAAGRGYDDEARQILQQRTVIVCGGSGAVSDESVAGLSTIRLAGDDIYATSAAVADWTLEHGMSASNVTVASAILDYKGVDALAACALAGRSQGVVLLAQSNGAFPYANTRTVLEFLAAHESQIYEVNVLGGTAASTPQFYNDIKAVLHEA